MTRKLLSGVAVLGLMTGFVAAADTPAPPAKEKSPTPDPSRKIVRWPGGWMYLDAPGVIYHDSTPSPKSGVAGATNVIMDSANGVGNSITIDNGGKPGVTVLRNVRNGIGNKITVTPDGPVIELPAKPVVPAKP